MSFDLGNEILENPYGFNFYQAVHLIERYLSDSVDGHSSYRGKGQKIQFRTDNSIAFPSSDVVSIKKHDKSGIYTLYLSFMGLYGVSSPLPSYFTEPLSRGKEEYEPLKFFLDIFSHRIYEVFYKSWKKYRFYIQYTPGKMDDISKALLAFTGQGESVSSGITIPHFKKEMAKLPLSKLMYGRIRSSANLRQFLMRYFGFSKVSVEQFAPNRIKNPAPCKLGSEQALLSASILGTEIVERIGSFKVTIGPLAYKKFKKFLPDRTGEVSSIKDDVRKMVAEYIDAPLEYTITVCLDYQDPECVDNAARLGEGAALGYNVWLGEPNENITLNI